MSRYICFFLLLFARAYALEVICEGTPPFGYMEDGQPKGMAVEVVQAVLREARMLTDIQVNPWNEAFRRVSTTPNVLLFPAAMTQERAQNFQWVGPITPQIYSCFIGLRSRQKQIELTSLSDAKKYHIGTIDDDYNEAFLRQNGFSQTKLACYNTIELLMRKLLDGQVDLILYPKIIADGVIKKWNKSTEIIMSYLLVQRLSMDYYIAINSDTPTSVVKELQRALDEVKKNGTFDEIVNKYDIKN